MVILNAYWNYLESKHGSAGTVVKTRPSVWRGQVRRAGSGSPPDNAYLPASRRWYATGSCGVYVLMGLRERWVFEEWVSGPRVGRLRAWQPPRPGTWTGLALLCPSGGVARTGRGYGGSPPTGSAIPVGVVPL